MQEATALFKSVTVALVGIGAVEPSKMLAASGNVFSPQELEVAQRSRRGRRHLPPLLRRGRRRRSITPLERSRDRIELRQLRARPARGRHRRRRAQDRRDPRRAARPVGERADHRSRHRRAPRRVAPPSTKPDRRGHRCLRQTPAPEHGATRGGCGSPSARCSTLCCDLPPCRPWTIRPIETHDTRCGVRRGHLRRGLMAAASADADQTARDAAAVLRPLRTSASAGERHSRDSRTSSRAPAS